MTRAVGALTAEPFRASSKAGLPGPFDTSSGRMHSVSQFKKSVTSNEDIIHSSLQNMARNNSIVVQGDVLNFFRYSPYDPKILTAEQKYSRQIDFKQQLVAALGVTAEDSATSSSIGDFFPDDIKRVKIVLHESTVKSRERMKIFSESLSVFNKCFPSIPSKKRSRLESFPTERSSSFLSCDQSVQGQIIGKLGTRNHAGGSGFGLEQQNSEEKGLNPIPNKRTRTSLLEVRGAPHFRNSGTVDRGREVVLPSTCGTIHVDDTTLSLGIDGWEKTKLKKKRSGIKSDVSVNMMSSKASDCLREPKQGMQHRPVTNTHSRLNNDFQGLRRESSAGSDKERINVRAGAKVTVSDDNNACTITKINSNTRAPRSASGVATKSSTVIHRSPAPSDGELSPCKPPAIGSNNHRCIVSTQSYSPVTNWAGQRLPKNSRTARRTNLVPVVASKGEAAVDTTSDISGSEIGLGFSRHLCGSSPPQVRPKAEPLSSPALSESEESGTPEIKCKDKWKKSEDIDQKVGRSQKVSNMAILSRKNKLASGEDFGDCVRRQWRSGRGFTSTRSLVPGAIEKLINVGTAKQLRSSRLGFDKNESKAGRPPTRKLSDRKEYKFLRHTTIDSGDDFFGSEDDHEDLFAAASDVHNEHSCSSFFWMKMEPFFAFISDVDTTYLNELGDDCTMLSSTLASSNVNNFHAVANGYDLQHEREKELATKTKNFKNRSQQLVPGTRGIPLFQRLIAAIISEEDCNYGNENQVCDACGTRLELDGEVASICLCKPQKFCYSQHSLNGMAGNQDHDNQEIGILCSLNSGVNQNIIYPINGIIQDQRWVSIRACSEFQYDNMDFNEKLYLELHSIGLFPETLAEMQTEDEGLNEAICDLKDNHRGQVFVAPVKNSGKAI